MSNQNEPPQPVDRPLSPVDSPRPAQPPINDIVRLALLLDPDERLRLVARLWKTLPRGHRAALVSLQLEESQSDRDEPILYQPERAGSPLDVWPKLRERLLDPTYSSGLYSAPRRFDLATIFVVTAAYSLLLAGLSMLGALPVVMVVIAGLLAIIAATQALFKNVANPRGVSVITGSVAFTIMMWLIWLNTRRFFPNSFFVVTVIFGIIGGGILGYLGGTLVGGVFLIADVVRNKLEGQRDSENDDQASEPPSPFADDTD